MSLPRPGHDYCRTCWADDPMLCTCNRHYCQECRVQTNHTTAQHQLAERVMCRECNDVEVHDEASVCSECVSQRASYYTPDDEGGQG